MLAAYCGSKPELEDAKCITLQSTCVYWIYARVLAIRLMVLHHLDVGEFK